MIKIKVLVKILVFSMVSIWGLLFLIGEFVPQSIDTAYECHGTFTNKGQEYPKIIYMKIHKFKSLCKLFWESDANMNVEIPHTLVEYYPRLYIHGDQIEIYNFDKELVGTFSTLSNSLSLKIGSGYFEGKGIKILTEKNQIKPPSTLATFQKMLE